MNVNYGESRGTSLKRKLLVEFESLNDLAKDCGDKATLASDRLEKYRYIECNDKDTDLDGADPLLLKVSGLDVHTHTYRDGVADLCENTKRSPKNIKCRNQIILIRKEKNQ